MINLDIPGFCPLPQLAGIEAISQSVKKDGIIVEIGSLFGRTAYTWAASSDSSVKVFCIDPWDGSKIDAYTGFSMRRGVHLGKLKNTAERFAENLCDFSEKVFQIRDYSPLDNWTYGDIDVVYIDGNHTYEAVSKDIRFWFRHLKRGGVMCGDDYSIQYGGTVRAVDEVAQEMSFNVVTLGKFWLFGTLENSIIIDQAKRRFEAEWASFHQQNPGI